ncbi:MAG: FG-GAP-like repeat-containing protein [Cystobacterineae bacterium]|nr:FG-GAP-like repeat-containing protein [Cystobacterineae bacterium]
MDVETIKHRKKIGVKQWRGPTFYLFLALALSFAACGNDDNNNNDKIINDDDNDNNAAETELFVPLITEQNNTGQIPSAVPFPSDSYNNATAEQSQRIESIKQRRTTKSVSLTRVDVNAFKADNVLVSLPSNKRPRLSKKHFEAKDSNNFTWSGEILGTFSSSTFVVQDGNIAGSIRDENNELYSIEPIGEGVHALIQIDESSFPPSAKPLLDYVDRIQSDALSATIGALSAPAPADANPVEIDVLVAFTPAALRAHNNMALLIQLAVEEANQSYRNSGINIRLRLTDSFEFNYSESGRDYSTILSNFAASPIVNDRRNASGADVAMLIVNQQDYCGMAYLLPSASYAFGLVHYSCATGNYTFAHEIGHIQGAGHDEQTDRNPYFSYGHGYIHPSNTSSQSFRTVMAYACTNTSCPRIPYWSNPNMSYNGIVTGTSHTNNNVRVLNETAQRVAGFRNRQLFTYNSGWRVDRHPIILADITGNRRADIVAFGDDGVYTARSNANGTFEPSRLVLEQFGYNIGGWRTDMHPRFLADINGDGRADIVGFGYDGVWTALSRGDGTFNTPRLVLQQFGYVVGGWRTDMHPRFLADINGDGRADIVGFGYDGVWTALSRGDGTFDTPRLVLQQFGYVVGGWRTDMHPRFIADINGDGRADIVAFGYDGVWTALSRGDGTFDTPRLVLQQFGYDIGGWRTDMHPRFLADINGDGRADIVGFGYDGVWTALSRGDGTFDTPRLVLQQFSYVVGGWRTDMHPRFLADINGDGRADIVGFGYDGVWTALSSGDGTFNTPRLVLQQFGYVAGGWRTDIHPRFLADINGDGRADIVGFGDSQVLTAFGNSNGTF